MIKASASSLDRIAACPGSHAAESRLPERNSRDADEGTNLHDVMSGARDRKGLTSGQIWAVEFCERQDQALWLEHVAGLIWDERREWASSAQLLDSIITGKPDRVIWGGNLALVEDYKFGRIEVDHAEINLQLRAYAILAAQENRHHEAVTVAIIQPHATLENRVTVAQYAREDILQAKAELNDILVTASKADAPRRPGAHCRYCKALGTSRCPESTEQAMALAPLTNAQVMPVGAELAKFLEAKVLLKPMLEALDNHAREQLQADPASIPGWYLTDDIPVRKLPDVETAWAAADAAGVTAAEFMAACSVGVGALEEKMRAKFGWRAKDTKDQFDRIMAEALASETKRGSIKRRKE